MTVFAVTNARFVVPDGTEIPVPSAAIRIRPNDADRVLFARWPDGEIPLTLPSFTITFKWSVFTMPRHRLCAYRWPSLN